MNRNPIKTRRGDRRGSTLIVVMMMTLVSTVAISSVLFSVSARVQRVNKQVQLEQAFYLAEAGVERAAASVAAGNEYDATLTGSLASGSYVAVIDCTSHSGGAIDVEITSTGTVGGVSRTVTVHGLRRVSWARYALWYDQEATSLVIAAGDSFKGRVYSKPLMRFSNSGLSTNGKAHFYDKVWTVPSYIQYDSGAYPILDYGIVTSAEVQSIASVDFADLKAQTQASSSGLVLNGNATIVLDGTTMKITNIPNGWTNRVVTIPENGIVYAKAYSYTKTTYDYRGRAYTTTVTEAGDITVSSPNGLNGQLTLVSENDINIVGHIRYASDPATNPNSDDKLGLIAQDNVVVQTAAPNNLEVYAHILCKNGGFGVYNYNTGSSRGILKIYGGIANLIRNAVGTTTPTGFLKNYIFDSRLARNPPPFYPKVVDELEWDWWEG